MIDYSVYMMTPAYSKDETPKAYAKNQVSEIWSLEKFAKHISDHNGGYSRGTVKGVISDMCECLVEQLLNGNKVQLGELGTFGISISCEGAESIEKFTSKNIKEVNILFTPGVDFENLINRAEFNPVALTVPSSIPWRAVPPNRRPTRRKRRARQPWTWRQPKAVLPLPRRKFRIRTVALPIPAVTTTA